MLLDFLFNAISSFHLLIYRLTSTRVPMTRRVDEAQSRPKREYTPKPKPSFDYGQVENSNGGYTPTATSPPYHSAGNVCVCVRAAPPASFPCVDMALIDVSPPHL